MTPTPGLRFPASSTLTTSLVERRMSCSKGMMCSSLEFTVRPMADVVTPFSLWLPSSKVKPDRPYVRLEAALDDFCFVNRMFHSAAKAGRFAHKMIRFSSTWDHMMVSATLTSQGPQGTRAICATAMAFHKRTAVTIVPTIPTQNTTPRPTAAQRSKSARSLLDRADGRCLRFFCRFNCS